MQQNIIDTTRNVYRMMQDYADQGVDVNEELNKQILELSYQSLENIPGLQMYLPIIREVQTKVLADTYAVMRAMNEQFRVASSESFGMAESMAPQLEESLKRLMPQAS
jgi:hypothetical protein